MRSCGVFAGEIRQQVDAVELPGRIDRAACRGDAGGHHVELHDGLLVDLAGRQMALPLGNERQADAAFPGGMFLAAQHAVAIGDAWARRCR